MAKVNKTTLQLFAGKCNPNFKTSKLLSKQKQAQDYACMTKVGLSFHASNFNSCKFRASQQHDCYLTYRPFARSGHIVRNKLQWDANYAVGLSKQRKVGLDWYEFLCFGSPTA